MIGIIIEQIYIFHGFIEDPDSVCLSACAMVPERISKHTLCVWFRPIANSPDLVNSDLNGSHPSSRSDFFLELHLPSNTKSGMTLYMTVYTGNKILGKRNFFGLHTR